MKITLKNLFKLLGLDKVDWKKATTRLLAILWLVLGICFILKIFGGNWFGIMTNNQTYIKVCEILEQTKLYYVVYYPFYMFSCYLTALIIMRDKPCKKHLYLIVLFTLSFITKSFYNTIGFIFEMIIYLGISLKVSKAPWRAIETMAITMLFQVISLVVKNVGYKQDNENVVTTLITLIDYYIMMSIYCVNTVIRKESLIMGLVGPFFMSKKGEQLVAYRNKLVEKKAKLDARIKDIDRAIENEKIENK